MTFVCLAYHAKYVSLLFPLLRMTHFSQRGKEQEVVWRLLNKMQAKESVEVASVLAVFILRLVVWRQNFVSWNGFSVL